MRVIRIRKYGNVGNNMFQYMFCRMLQFKTKDSIVVGYDMPMWNLSRKVTEKLPLEKIIVGQEHVVDVERLAVFLNSGTDRLVDFSGIVQRLEYYGPHDLMNSFFNRNDSLSVPQFGSEDLVISVRGSEILSGKVHPGYIPIPLGFYHRVISETHKNPVFVGQIGDDFYSDALRSSFPDARFVPSMGPAIDFEILRSSRHIVLSVSTFAWLAAWMSPDVKTIHMPVLGIYNQNQRPDVDLLPVNDPRYRFYLFPPHVWRGDRAGMEFVLSQTNCGKLVIHENMAPPRRGGGELHDMRQPLPSGALLANGVHKMTTVPLNPIVIISFNRPDYFRRVLDSLAAQVDAAIFEREIFLFQDGAYNRHSGSTRCSQETIDQIVNDFHRVFPRGTVMAAPENLGIALNFARAENFVFTERGFEAAVFFEDDLVLGKYYLKTLDKLLDYAMHTHRIGYVTAYGNHKATLAEQIANKSKLTLMGQNWGFGLTRRQWLAQKPFVDQYLNIIKDSDYSSRDHDKIIDLFHSWGLGVPGTSQDIAKSHACILTNSAKVNTFPSFGKYIGASGFHFNKEMFSRMGFDKSEFVEEDIFELTPLTTAELDGFVSTARRSALVEAVSKKSVSSSVAPGKNSPDVLDALHGLFAKRRYEEAEALCRSTFWTHPDIKDKYGHPVYLKESLRIALAQDRFDIAGGLAERLAAAVLPTDPCVPLLYARHYEAIGKTDEARAKWAEVLRIAPQNGEALKKIG